MEKSRFLKVGLGLFAMAGAICLPDAGWAGPGLQTKFGVVTIENLQPGETYNTRELASLPMVVQNTGDEGTTVKIDILPPNPDSPGLVHDGYAPIPDLSWIKLSKEELDLQAGESQGADVLITVPNDDKYLGKKYQVDFWIHTVTKKFLAVGLRSNLRFTVASRRLTAEEADQRKKIQQFGKIDFDLIPNKAVIENVALGREVDLERDYKTALKVSNPNDQGFLYYLDLVGFRDADLRLPPNYAELPADMIRLQEKDVKVPENSIKKVKVTLNIPNDEKYRGKQFCFAIRGRVAGTPVELNQVSRFFITTQK